MSNKELIAALVTTDKRGVFFGLINKKDLSKTELVIENMQMCIYWSEETKGVLGLAAHGPDQGCRITAPVVRGSLSGITMICECSDEAVTAWGSQPWK